MSTELEKAVAPKLMDLLGRYRGQIEQILPKQFNSQRVLKLIVGAINRNNDLLRCTPMSVINSVLTAATMGLEIRPGMAYLIPYGRECTLIIDYRGKIDLALRSGKVLDIDPDIVYSKEKFRLYRDEQGRKCIEHEPLLYGVDEQGAHRPLTEADRGVPVGAYAVAAIKDGPPKVVFMAAIDIDKIRLKSRAKDNGPWKTDTMEMWKKTVVHRICKTLPQSPELALAQDVTEREEAGVDLSNILDVEPVDDDQMPILPEGSVKAAEAVAERKISEMQNGGNVIDVKPTADPAPKAAPTSAVSVYSTWAAWEESGSKNHPVMIIESGENAGRFELVDGNYRAVQGPAAEAPAPPKKPKLTFGGR